MSNNYREELGENMKVSYKNDYKPWLVSVSLFFADLIGITLAFFLATLIRIKLIPLLSGEVEYKLIISVFSISLLLIVISFFINNLYPGAHLIGVIEIRRVFILISSAYIGLAFVFFSFGIGTQFSRFVFILSWFFCFLFISIFRLIIHNRGSIKSWWQEPILIVGTKENICQLVEMLNRSRRLAMKPVIALMLDNDMPQSIYKNVHFYPYSEEKLKPIKNSGIKKVLFLSKSVDINKPLNKIIIDLNLIFPSVIYVLADFPVGSQSIHPFDIEGFPALKINYDLLNSQVMLYKRFFDLFLSSVSFCFSFPFLLLISLAIKVDSKGPILYKQKRIGKNGVLFNIYKFRTMKVNADEILKTELLHDPKYVQEFKKYHKLKRDPRITRVGAFLRKTSLDELPQIFNVFKGEMSIVGPRAYLPEELEEIGYSKRLIQRVLPGLTGWWQVMGRHEVIFEERIRLDEYYIYNFSIWMDLYIILKTFWIILSGNGR